MPPSRACGICRNRLNEVCVEECAPSRKYKYFNPDMDISIHNMPSLNLDEYRELPGCMKGKWLFIQQNKILEVLYGDERHINYPRSRRILKVIKKQSLQAGQRGDIPSFKIGKSVRLRRTDVIDWMMEELLKNVLPEDELLQLQD